ncbi:A24 family peptidase [Methylococcus sp. EFPC2]|uniref:prepilin peptidase n=1 Tax=Methylococcus sp. EFPC2 TaxID=2812648 RepID=UPI0019673E0A|nr:A24 family peptidase [Methylococcus sp. EFPC2]QSA98458.1 prepilin peptidase [Methylococcus sp. EFPC2]
MYTLQILLDSPALSTTLAGLLGLIVGSFLNVVVYRLPLMMERDWKRQCHEYLGQEVPAPHDPKLNLVTPRSRCPHCGHAIGAHENIPVLSYLLLKGRCSACNAAISVRYPVIEVFTALVSAVVVWRLGPTWQAALALPFSWGLISLAVIDIDHQLLPDAITQPLLWCGLLLSLFGIYTDSASSIIGAVAGYLGLWLVYHAFKLTTGKEGMGYGDFKLLAVFGAWLGWQMLLPVVLLSSLVGAIIGIGLIWLRGHDRNIPIPFGPYLAAAGWIALLWGEDLIEAYQNFAGLTS